MQKAVDSGELPGVVILIARDGRLAYAKSFGWQDREKKIPMRNDSIFPHLLDDQAHRQRRGDDAG